MVEGDVRDDVGRRRRWSRALWLVLPVLVATVIGAGVVLTSLRAEPEFYQQARRALADRPTRRQAAARFEEKTEEFARSLQADGGWRHEFTQDEINAWLIDELPVSGEVQLPRGVSEPLVQLIPGTLQIGFRVETKQYRGVLSVALHPEIEPDGDVVLTVGHIRAGEMEVPARQILDEVSKSLSRASLPIELQRGDEERIVVDLKQAAPDWRDVELTSISVETGRVTFQGRRESVTLVPDAPPESSL